MMNPYNPQMLPLRNGQVHYAAFVEELIDATAKLEVYKEKIRDSKLDSSWFMPTLQQKEALASSKLEGTQATLDGVLSYQAMPDAEDENLNEVLNYNTATVRGYKLLLKDKFSDEFFCELHKALMDGNVRKQGDIGSYRTHQNYIGRNDISHAITFTPPAPQKVPELMTNLIDYINEPSDNFRPLVRAAIIHAQFETIHPFGDGNGRVGRMLIPMYLFAARQIELPCFFISEALEHNKIKYYTLLNDTRKKENWDEWIKFFLNAVTAQCEKYIGIVSAINSLYDRDLSSACEATKSQHAIVVMNTLYKFPVTTSKQMQKETGLPPASLNRILNVLVEKNILYTNNKHRNRTFYYYDLLEIIR